MKVNFLSILAVLFIGLKLGGVIAWSWWLVLLPVYGGLLFFMGIFVFAFLGVALFR